MSPEKLSPAEIERRLQSLPDWVVDQHKLYRQFVFRDFVEAFGFISRVALLAEAMNHHPDLGISWNKVTVAITNHAEGGLTEKDFELAGKVQSLA